MVILIVSGVFLGYAPLASGTFGTLAGIPLCLGLSFLPLWAYLGLAAAFILAAIILCQRAEAIFEAKDDGRIVIDEVAGYLVTMIGIKPGFVVIIVGFLLFRIFDIFKPWPARLIDQKLAGGAGVVLDDVAAGVYACVILHLLAVFWPALGRAGW